jgi:hypothetical protein
VNFWNFIPSSLRGHRRAGVEAGKTGETKLRHILFGWEKKGKIKERELVGNRRLIRGKLQVDALAS